MHVIHSDPGPDELETMPMFLDDVAAEVPTDDVGDGPEVKKDEDPCMEEDDKAYLWIF